MADATVIGWVSFTAAMAAMTLGTVRFLFPNVLSEPPSKFKVGYPEQLRRRQGRRDVQGPEHLGRPRPGQDLRPEHDLHAPGLHAELARGGKKFKCPCHGSGFYITGINFEGPAPRPLERWAIGVGDDGQIVVDKSKKFQKELGQWDNPDSYI